MGCSVSPCSRCRGPRTPTQVAVGAPSAPRRSAPPPTRLRTGVRIGWPDDRWRHHPRRAGVVVPRIRLASSTMPSSRPSRVRCCRSGPGSRRPGCACSPPWASARRTGRTAPAMRCRGWRGGVVSAGQRRGRSWSWPTRRRACPPYGPVWPTVGCRAPRRSSSDGPPERTRTRSRPSLRPRRARRSRRWRGLSTDGSSSTARRPTSRCCQCGSPPRGRVRGGGDP